MVATHAISKQTGDVRSKIDALLKYRVTMEASLKAAGKMKALADSLSAVITRIDDAIAAAEASLQTTQDNLGVILAEFGVDTVPDEGSETSSVVDDRGDDGIQPNSTTPALEDGGEESE
jgi:hypothetical protein